MLFVYYKHSGEIYQASSPEKNLKEFFGEANYEAMSLVFDYIYIEEYNNTIFTNFTQFKVVDGELVLKENSIFKNLFDPNFSIKNEKNKNIEEEVKNNEQQMEN